MKMERFVRESVALNVKAGKLMFPERPHPGNKLPELRVIKK
jgi:hypothetical protein